LMTAENVHGKTGIDGIDIFKPKTLLKELHAVDFIVKTLKDADTDSITLVPTGPLTNIALAIIKDPSILDSIKQIVLMGGAMREAGNLSASAEFNMRVDPHAAKVVFECGLPIIVMSLDVTHKVLTSKERVSEIESIGNSVSTATANMLKFFARYDSEKYGVDGAPLHDPCTIAWLLNQNLFIGKECNVRIETESSLTLGHTSVDFWGVEGNIPNAIWMQDVDDDGFYDLLINRLRRFD